MSTYTSEPGTRLAGRYRLVDQAAVGSGWIMWKAMDETLARPVSVLTFAPGFPRIAQVVTAARAASRLTDPRLAQVFDVEDGDQAYVVLEWVGGETLTALLADGPLDSARACALMADAARALAGAHAAGQAHLRLTPETLRWTRSSGIKITGLGIDAALVGDGLIATAANDPAGTDTQDLAALLYAALTGYWPGESQSGLPSAPTTADGMVCTPRQVTADVSPGIDGVVCRALLQRPGRQGPPILDPGAFADALASVAPPVPLPDPAPPVARSAFDGHQRYDYPNHGGYGGYPPNPDDPGTWATPDRSRGGTAPYQRQQHRYPAAQRGAGSRAVVIVVIVLVIAAVAAAAWVMTNNGSKSGGPKASGTTSSRPKTGTTAPAPAATVLKPVGDSTFNIFGSPPGNTEDPGHAGDAIDNNPDTFWATSFYFSPNFGNLKPGTGLLIDMGREVRLSQVEVQFGTTGSTTAEIYLGNSNAMSSTALSNFTKVAPAATASGDHVYPIHSSATGRYVLIWLTGNLPPDPQSPGNYQAQIYNVVTRGSDVPGTG
jgi:serine/threonine protein kinase